MNTMLRPSRTRHNGDTGADVQQGPVSRILFRLRPCVNLFYCLLLIHIPRILSTIEKDADVLACGHVRILHVPGHSGFIIKGIVQPGIYYRPNTLGSVRRREFGLICISSESCLWSNVGFARLLCFAALRSVSSANAAPGELLCPGSAW